MKAYLGDAVYAEITDDGMLKLTTNDGLSETNTIFLEPEVYHALQQFMTSGAIMIDLGGLVPVFVERGQAIKRPKPAGNNNATPLGRKPE